MEVEGRSWLYLGSFTACEPQHKLLLPNYDQSDIVKRKAPTQSHKHILGTRKCGSKAPSRA